MRPLNIDAAAICLHYGQEVFEGLAAQAPERPSDPRLKDLRQVLTVVDATLLPALPRMAWAVWLGDRGRGAKAHIQFEVLKGTAVHGEVTTGQESDVACLKANLEPGVEVHAHHQPFSSPVVSNL